MLTSCRAGMLAAALLHLQGAHLELAIRSDLQGVLVLAARRAAADVDVLDRLS